MRIVGGTNTHNSSSDSFNETNQGSSASSSASTIDFETIMKFKSVMDKMNSKDDPRAKLLISLKPYLKDSRKSKVDQYIQFFNMSKIMGMFTNGDGKL